MTRVIARAVGLWESFPLEQPIGDHGEIQDPVMICPVCEDEFRATGMRWLGAFNVADITDEQIDAWAAHFVDTILGDAVEQESEPG